MTEEEICARLSACQRMSGILERGFVGIRAEIAEAAVGIDTTELRRWMRRHGASETSYLLESRSPQAPPVQRVYYYLIPESVLVPATAA